jgi:hypothetical protein
LPRGIEKKNEQQQNEAENIMVYGENGMIGIKEILPTHIQ